MPPTGGELEITLLNPNRYPDVPRARLEGWMTRLLGDLAPDASSFAVRLTGDRAMRELNRRYRKKDRTTDVLSFAGEPTPEGRHLGDLAISVPVARRQASERGHSLEIELACLMLHGALHCMGYDHETDDGEMSRMELSLRERWVEGWAGEAEP